MKFQLILFWIGFLCFSQECKIPKSFKEQGFQVFYSEKKAELNEFFRNSIVFKAPKSGKDIKSIENLKCSSKVASFANVVHIKVLDVLNLPKGMSWSTNKKDNILKKGESGCLFINGRAQNKGLYNLVVKVEGFGSFIGIKKKINCTIEGFPLSVN